MVLSFVNGYYYFFVLVFAGTIVVADKILVLSILAKHNDFSIWRCVKIVLLVIKMMQVMYFVIKYPI